MKKTNHLFFNIFFIIVAIVIIAIVVFYCFGASLLYKFVNNYIDDGLPNVSISGSIDYEPTRKDEAIISAVTGLYFTYGEQTQEFVFTNPSDNNCAVQIQLYLGDGTLLYQSDYIAPGETIKEISIENILSPGIYHNCVMVYNYCSLDESHNLLTRCDINIEITVME